jgi:hypothetical protein
VGDAVRTGESAACLDLDESVGGARMSSCLLARHPSDLACLWADVSVAGGIPAKPALRVLHATGRTAVTGPPRGSDSAIYIYVASVPRRKRTFNILHEYH